MQTNYELTRLAKGDVRKVGARLFVSFSKQYDGTVDFFTLDSSHLDGTHILAGVNNTIQEWAKFAYTEYSNRIISASWTREKNEPYSVVRAIADLVLDNSDDFFTTGAGSTIDGTILPARPIKLFATIGGEAVQVFVGLIESVPERDDKAKTITVHCIDFLTYVYNKPLDEAVMYQNYRIDQAISAILQLGGLSSLQLDLDHAYNTVPYIFFDKGKKIGDALDELVQADLGYLNMDELGVVRYRNRQSYQASSVYTFNDSNTIERKVLNDAQIVNVVEVKSDIRQVQTKDKVWQTSTTTPLPAGASVEIWADFQDPVTSVDAPEDISVATTSSFTTNAAEDGSGAALTSVTVATSLFSKSMKMTFTNASGVSGYITAITLEGTAVRAISKLYVREEDTASVAKYGERIYTIDNQFIQDNSTATSLAKVLLTQRAEFGSIEEAEVKGNPALQIDDPITYGPYHNSESYFISKQVNDITPGRFKQVLIVSKRKILSYFTLDSSYLDGGDVLAL